MTDPGRRVQSSEKTLAALEYVFEQEAATVSELASEMDLAKSTVHSHLATLGNAEFLVQDGNEYRISLKFLEYGIRARNATELFAYMNSTLEEVAKETGESVGLFTAEHGHLVYLDAEEGERSVRTHGTIGTRSYLHDSAAGKAIIAHLPREEVERVLKDRGMPAQTQNTITDPEELFAALEEIRENGIAYNRAETMAGVRAVASPVLVEGEVYGSIGVAGPENRLTGTRFTDELPTIVRGATNEIELRISSSRR